MSNEKNALVTGAGSGIGRAVAESLGAMGIKVWVTDMNLESAQNVAEAIVAAGGQAEARLLNVTDQEGIDRLANEVRIDVLVNNAGVQHVAKLENFPADRWRLLTDILLVGPAMMTRAVIPQMRERGFGRIVNIGSIHSLVGSPYKSAYVAAKHGLIGFSKVVALETADQDITINTICPSYVKTPLVEQQVAQQAKEHGISEEEVINNIMLEPMPKKNFIGTDELAASVAFLISAEARNITGQTLVLDGGWTAR